MSRVRTTLADPRTPTALFAGAAAIALVLEVALMSRMTFFIDDWEILLHRRGFTLDDFMIPHAGHISMSLVAVYKAIQATLGMDSITPYAAVAAVSFVASVCLLFVWTRRRVGDWLALAATLPILFLGAAFEDLLTPFQLGFTAAVACGIGALLCLERRDRRGDIACCALLVLALSFQTLGLMFVAAVAVAIVLNRELRDRAWVVIVPAVFYALWYVGWHDSDSNDVTFDSLATAPSFVVDGFASSASSLFGLAGPVDGAHVSSLEWGRPLLALLVIVAGARLLRGRVPTWFWAMLAAGVSWWLLIGANAGLLRAPTSSRYQYIGAVFLVMAAAELARGWRPRWPVIAIALGVSVLAAASNANLLHTSYKQIHGAVPVYRGSLAGLEIAGDVVEPDFVLTPENSGAEYFTLVDAGSYLSAASAFGSTAYSEAELATAPETARVAADKVVAAAERIRLEPSSAPPQCTPVAPGADGTTTLTLQPGRTVLRAGGSKVGLGLRRYAAASFPVELGSLDPGDAAVVEVPADRSEVSWTLGVVGSGLETC